MLAQQNLEQLTSGLREAVLASTNNVIVFRTGPLKVAAANERLGSWSRGPLTRLPRLAASATVSTGSGLTRSRANWSSSGSPAGSMIGRPAVRPAWSANAEYP